MAETFDSDEHAVNPYAAPSAELQEPAPQQAPHTAAGFYALSPLKLMVMSTLTVGMYDLYFWWQQWSARRRAGEDVSVFWRTLFAGITSFSFRTTLTTALVLRDQKVSPALSSAPIGYLIFAMIDRAVDRMTEKAVIDPVLGLSLSIGFSLLRAGMLVIIQRSVNDLLRAENYRGPVNRGVSAGALAIGLLGVLIWIFGVYGTLYPEPTAS